MHGISKSIRKLIKASLEHDTHRLLRCLIEMLDAYRLVYELIHTGMYEHDTMLHVPFLQNIHEKAFAWYSVWPIGIPVIFVRKCDVIRREARWHWDKEKGIDEKPRWGENVKIGKRKSLAGGRRDRRYVTKKIASREGGEKEKRNEKKQNL